MDRCIVRTKYGDQLHLGSLGSARTSCGSKKYTPLFDVKTPRQIKSRKGMFCERCFGPERSDDGRDLTRWNEMIVGAQIVCEAA